MTSPFNPYDPPQSSPGIDDAYRRLGCVSIWAGTFGSIDAAEWYFGVPALDGRAPPPYSFIEDFQLAPFSVECLEISFTQAAPRPLRALLESASFSSSYIEAACAEGERLGIDEAQGVALLFNYDYGACSKVLIKSPQLRFLGVFDYDPDAPIVRRDPDQLRTSAEIAAAVGCSEWAVLALHAAMQSLNEAGQNPFTARRLCEAVQLSEGGPEFLRKCGLSTSEDLGRLVYRLVDIGFMRTSPGDKLSDFDGVYSLKGD